MLCNYLKITLRNLKRAKIHSIINLLGLATGIACCILILLWVQDELGYDKFHAKLDSIYEVHVWQQYGSTREHSWGSVPALGPALQAEYPEILRAARFNNGLTNLLIRFDDKHFKEDVQLADPELFDIFSFPFLFSADSAAFLEHQVIVFNEDVAQKYFGETNPVGKIVTIENQYDFKVVGVMKNIPHNSTIQFKVWAPLTFQEEIYRPDYLATWYNLAFRTYVELAPEASIAEVNPKILNRIRQSRPTTRSEPFLYPFKDIYLKGRGHRGIVIIFSFIGFMILLIACINFMNLTTARSARRAREVGLRKVIGARRRELMAQFWGESFLFVFFALLVAIILAEFFLPTFQQLTGKPLKLDLLNNFSGFLGILGIVFLTGVLAGSYPALFLSSFQPAKVLKGIFFSGSERTSMRKGLVIFQFTLSILLIISTLVIYRQIEFMKERDLGFDKQQLLFVKLTGNLEKNPAVFKNEIRQHPKILNATVTSHSPTGIYWNGQGWNWPGRDPNCDPLVTYFNVDPDFVATFKMEMKTGRFFTENAEGGANDVVINESFAEMIGLEHVVGAALSGAGESFRIIGVINNFHYKPLWRSIGPIMIFSDPDGRQRYLFARVDTDQVGETIAFIREKAAELNPAFPFEYRFLDEDYARMYQSQERLGQFIRIFAFLAILISCLGLFGLAIFMTEQRTKEIGIRKALGASVSGIVLLLSREFLRWVVIANLIAWPLGYLLLSGWLQNFAYRTPIGLWIFIFAGGISLFVALLTVSSQTVKAAFTRPINALRYE